MKAAAHIAIPALWISWLAYWLWAARDTKKTERRESIRSHALRHLPLIIGGLLIGLPHAFGPLDGRFVAPDAAWDAAAAVLIALGLGFAALARRWLGRNWSGTVTVKAGHELIRSGPYGYVRHPIYTGLLLALIGTALAIGEWRAVLGFVLIAAAIVHKLTVEERFMTEQFGDAYTYYRAEVPMLVPLLL
jgi:protein-S-isoprenylcysteine O-methyltransferase Ste14